jgi:hypothetical protein
MATFTQYNLGSKGCINHQIWKLNQPAWRLNQNGDSKYNRQKKCEDTKIPDQEKIVVAKLHKPT